MAEREGEVAQGYETTDQRAVDDRATGGYRGDRAAERAADGTAAGTAAGGYRGEPVADGTADGTAAGGYRGEPVADGAAADGYRGEPVAERPADEALVDGRRVRRGEYVAAPVAGEPVVEEPVVKRGGAAATAALVFGILALVTAFTVVGGVVLGILALIFGVIGSRRARRGIAYGRGRAIAGILTGLLGIIIAIALAGFFVSLVRGSDAKAMRSCVQHAGFNASAIHSCYKQYHH